MKLTKETLKQIIKEELNNLMEQEGEVIFTVKMGQMGSGIDINGMTTRDFSEKYPGSEERIKHLRIRVSELYSAMQGEMGSDKESSLTNSKRRVEEMAAAIARLDLGGAEFEVVYKQ